MNIDLTTTSLMTSWPKMKHGTPTLYPMSLGDKGAPIKLMFVEALPPALEDYTDNAFVLSAEKHLKQGTSMSTSQDPDSTDSTECGDVDILKAGAEEQGSRRARPCKGKRDRYKKLVKRIELQILDHPDSFNLSPVSLPPSLQSNDKQREKLMQRMLKFQRQVKMCQESVPTEVRSHLPVRACNSHVA